MSSNPPPRPPDFAEYPRPDCPWCGKAHGDKERCPLRRYQQTTTLLVWLVALACPLLCFGACITAPEQVATQFFIILALWLVAWAYIGYRFVKLRQMRESRPR